MKTRLVTLITTLLFAFSFYSQAQTFYTDSIYKASVHSVTLHPLSDSLGKPIIALNQGEQLKLDFDVFGVEAEYLNYTFVHCTHDWQPGSIQPIAYREGFETESIDNFAFSVNTLTDYVHYELQFPTSGMQALLSGNYILLVFSDDTTASNMYLSRRFMIVDEQASISGSVPRYPYDLNFGNTVQEVDFTVSYPNIFNSNAQEYINVNIQQNGRWDNAAIGLKPGYVYPNYLSFEKNPKTVFKSGNDFRYFSTSSIHYIGENIKSIVQMPNYYNVTLQTNEPRVGHPYVYIPGIQGEMYVNLDNYRSANTEADYCEVNFFLSYYPPFTHDEVYVLGALSDWKIDARCRMTYDYRRRGYALTLMLKQGFYNYMYATAPKGSSKADVDAIEGGFWDTNNEYTIFVYLYDPTQGYDRLIGVESFMAH